MTKLNSGGGHCSKICWRESLSATRLLSSSARPRGAPGQRGACALLAALTLWTARTHEGLR
ncbi:hypothetical protein [Streptomyces sp. NPDC052107]|uniref:hypothetical protein n=1 Tax=Streptomyces sp. NPDC052107 TaxID=3155632 RepID=UPI0034468980